jgi:molybdate transport system regulatory protein
MEEKLGTSLVRREKGGPGGGGSALTSEALELLEKFDLLRRGINQTIDNKFADIFLPQE